MPLVKADPGIIYKSGGTTSGVALKFLATSYANTNLREIASRETLSPLPTIPTQGESPATYKSV